MNFFLLLNKKKEDILKNVGQLMDPIDFHMGEWGIGLINCLVTDNLQPVIQVWNNLMASKSFLGCVI